MMTFDTKPTSQQLEDKSFWEGLPANGVLYDGCLYMPNYGILIDGKHLKVVTTPDGRELLNLMPYELALKFKEYLSQEHDNVTIDIKGYTQSFDKYEPAISS